MHFFLSLCLSVVQMYLRTGIYEWDFYYALNYKYGPGAFGVLRVDYLTLLQREMIILTVDMTDILHTHFFFYGVDEFMLEL
jgi:hypothetical protein